MFVLQLNDMRGNSDVFTVVAYAETEEALRAWEKAEQVAPYYEVGVNHFSHRETTWSKTYRKGGPLEWYNPPQWNEDFGVDTVYELPDREAYAQYYAEQEAQQARQRWDYRMAGALCVQP